MTLDEIKTLTSVGESETLEFKATTGTRREATLTVCAFLNQRGGQVLFGVTQDGTVAGQQVSERTTEELSAELRQIDPPAFPTVERVPADGGREVIVVSTGQGTPTAAAHQGRTPTAAAPIAGSDNTTLAMSADEYNRMLFERMHSEQRWENQPAPGWSVDDLDVAEIRRTVAEAVRRGRLEEPVSGDPSDMLRGLGLLRDAPARSTKRLRILPTVAVPTSSTAAMAASVYPSSALNRTRALATMRTEALPRRSRVRSRTRSSSAKSTIYFALAMSGCPPSQTFTIQTRQILKLQPRLIKTSWTDY